MEKLKQYDSAGMMEKCGKIIFIDKQDGPRGIYRALIRYGSAIKETNLFPKTWSGQKIMKKTLEALRTIDLNPHLSKSGEWLRGITKEGIIIEMYIDFKKSKIKTAYSVHDGWIRGELLKKYYGKK